LVADFVRTECRSGRWRAIRATPGTGIAVVHLTSSIRTPPGGAPFATQRPT